MFVVVCLFCLFFKKTHGCYVTQTLNPAADREICVTLKGLKRELAQQQGKSVLPGKKALPFTGYRWLALNLLKAPKTQYLFAHTVLVLSWNLMCRIGNAVAINWNSINWFEDAIQVFFSHSKN